MAGLGSGSPRLVTPWPPPYHAGHTIASPVRASQPMTRGDAMFETSTRWGLRALAALGLLAGRGERRRGAVHDHDRRRHVPDGTGRAVRAGRLEGGGARLPRPERGGGPGGLPPGRRDPGRPEPGHGRRRRRQAAGRDQAGAGHPRRHHLVRLDPHRHVGDGPVRRRPDLAGVVVADAHQPRARGQDGRLVLPHDHHRRAPGRGRGEVRARSGPPAPVGDPRQQRLRRQHGPRVLEGVRGARRDARLGHPVQPEPGLLPARGHQGAPGDARRPLPGQLSGGRRDDRADVDLAGRGQEVPPERRHEQRQVRPGRRRPAPERRLRHVVGHDEDAVHRVLRARVPGLRQAVRGGRAGRRPLLRRGGDPGPRDRPGREGRAGRDPRRDPQGARSPRDRRPRGRGASSRRRSASSRRARPSGTSA